MIQIKQSTTKKAFQTIESLADVIWKEHYIPMLGKPQIEYMLDKFQTAEAIKRQVEDGMLYFLLYFDVLEVGYFAIKPEKEALFLSKIYILKSHRNKGVAKKAMEFIVNYAKEQQLQNIRLTVNINNIHAIEAYKKLGFEITKPLVADIGNGFVMDDFEMVKIL